MGRFISQWHRPHGDERDAAAAATHRRFPVARVARIGIAAFVALGFLAAALASEQPSVMLVGLFPIAWLAVEAAWVLLRPPAEREER